LCSCRHLLTWMPPKSRSNRRNINLPSLRWWSWWDPGSD
jgi:hypothetical protein